jgi:hypothetical protein
MQATDDRYAQPVVAQPVQAQPVQAQPVMAQPVQAQPVQAQPVMVQPGVQGQQHNSPPFELRVPEVRDRWSDGIFDCFNQILPSCLMACFCSPFSYARIKYAGKIDLLMVASNIIGTPPFVRSGR